MKKVFTPRGFCNGETYVWGSKILPTMNPDRDPETGEILDLKTYQMMLEKKKEFDQDIIKISQWNEKPDGLDKELAEIFERRLNDILAYHDPHVYLSEGIEEEVDPITQQSLLEASTLLSDNPLDLEFSIPLIITSDEIERFLINYLPKGVFIKIASGNHATGCVRDDDGFVMFDPNNSKGEIRALNMKEFSKNVRTFLTEGNPYMEIFISHFSPIGKPASYSRKQNANRAKVTLLETIYHHRKKQEQDFFRIHSKLSTQLQATCKLGDSIVFDWCLNKMKDEAQVKAKEQGKENDQEFISEYVKELINISSPSVTAANRGHHKIVKTLLDKGAELFPRGTNQLFTEAVKHKRRMVVKTILEYAATLPSSPFEESPLKKLLSMPYEQVLPLTWAVDSDDIELVDDLAKAGADVNAGTYPDTALGKAVSNGNLAMVRKLLSHGANINFPLDLAEIPENNLLSKAIDNQDLRMVRLLYERGVKIEWIKDKLIDFCISQGDFEMLRSIMNKTKDEITENEILIQFYERSVNKAIKTNNVSLLKRLLSLDEVNISHFKFDGKNALMFALDAGADKEIIDALLEKQEEFDLTEVDENERNVLMIALEKGAKTEIIKVLLRQKKLDMNQVDKEGENVLMIALGKLQKIKKKDEGIEEIILAMIARPDLNVNQPYPETEYNVLMMALAINAELKIIQALLARKDLDLNYVNEDENALMFALEKGASVEHIKALLSTDINVNHLNNGMNALMIALGIGASVEHIKALLETGINLNHLIYGMNVLMIALEKELSTTVIELLLAKKELDLKQVDDNGRTALIIALEKRADIKIIKALLKRKDINLNHIDQKGNNALIIALNRGDREILTVLLAEEDLNVNHIDKRGDNALMIALQNDPDPELIKALLEKPFNLQEANKSGMNVLMLALEKSADPKTVEIVDALLARKKELNLNQVNSRNQDMLIIALKFCADRAIIEKLLKTGQYDLTRVDKYGEDALAYALKNYSDDKELIQALEKGKLGEPGSPILFSSELKKQDELRSQEKPEAPEKPEFEPAALRKEGEDPKKPS